MKDDSNMRELREQVWRRELTPLERRTVSEGADRDVKHDLAVEDALTSALRQLPDAPIASNFTQRVLQSIALERSASRRGRTLRFSIYRWLPRFAVGCVLIGGLFVWHGKVEAQRRAEMARSVAILSAPSLTPEILRDFDAIQVMSRTPAADEDLLALMQ